MGMVHTWASGPSSMLQAVHGFQLGCGGDHGKTPALCGFDATKSSNTWFDTIDTGSFESSGYI